MYGCFASKGGIIKVSSKTLRRKYALFTKGFHLRWIFFNVNVMILRLRKGLLMVYIDRRNDESSVRRIYNAEANGIIILETLEHDRNHISRWYSKIIFLRRCTKGDWSKECVPRLSCAAVYPPYTSAENGVMVNKMLYFMWRPLKILKLERESVRLSNPKFFGVPMLKEVEGEKMRWERERLTNM